MSFFDEHHHARRAHREFHKHGHKAHLGREILAGAAAFEAAKLYQEHCARNGKPPTHARAKEIFAALAGAFIEREFETRGMDAIDKHRAKQEAERHAEEILAGHY